MPDPKDRKPDEFDFTVYFTGIQAVVWTKPDQHDPEVTLVVPDTSVGKKAIDQLTDMKEHHSQLRIPTFYSPQLARRGGAVEKSKSAVEYGVAPLSMCHTSLLGKRVTFAFETDAGPQLGGLVAKEKDINLPLMRKIVDNPKINGDYLGANPPKEIATQILLTTGTLSTQRREVSSELIIKRPDNKPAHPPPGEWHVELCLRVHEITRATVTIAAMDDPKSSCDYVFTAPRHSDVGIEITNRCDAHANEEARTDEDFCWHYELLTVAAQNTLKGQTGPGHGNKRLGFPKVKNRGAWAGSPTCFGAIFDE